MSEEFLDRLLAVLDELPLLEHTRPEEWGPCALCLPGARKRSVSSLTIEAGPLVSPARLLQLCARCDASVRHMASDWPGDEAVLRRYRQLQAAGRISRRGRRRSGPASE